MPVYRENMRRSIGIVTILLALLALLSPSVAAGVCIVHGGPPIVSMAADDPPMQMPSPCEMQGGKRVLPAQHDLFRYVEEDPYALAAQWAGGLLDDLLPKGRTPAMELPPPRLG
ncbi:MAG: hypothetical protein ACO1OG_03110 [Devosia sp.]